MEGVYFTEIFWELCSVISVEELPNRNCFGIHSVIILCAMVFSGSGKSPALPKKRGSYQRGALTEINSSVLIFGVLAGSSNKSPVALLVAPYCAIPRDSLSDTPLFRAMGFLVSQHGQLGAIPLPPFLSVSPWSTCEVEVRYPPPKGYLSDTSAIPYENKANACDTPLCDTISKGYCAIWGGISRWAAKVALTEILVIISRGVGGGGGKSEGLKISKIEEYKN